MTRARGVVRVGRALDMSYNNLKTSDVDTAQSQGASLNLALHSTTTGLTLLLYLGLWGCADSGQSGSPSGACCKYCQTGCACGDSCIPCSNACHQPDGCACDGTPGTGPGDPDHTPAPGDGPCLVDECPAEYPVVPQCWVSEWNEDACRCDLLPLNGGVCDIESDRCRYGACDNGRCEATAALRDCTDRIACTIEWCDPTDGCVVEPMADLCDDGVSCTTDTCEVDVGCRHAPMAERCDDGNPCTVDVCQFGLGCAHDASDSSTCDDGDVCTDDHCDPTLGCRHLLNTAPCDDANTCTTGDRCAEGQCYGGEPVGCNDNNPCTDDACQHESGCTHTPNDGECEDGSLCTNDDRCAEGLCGPGSLVNCDDDNSCTTDSCDPEIGCTHDKHPEGTPCSDGNLCIIGDRCTDGNCVAGSTIMSCDDSNVCTDDSCIPELGCLQAPNQLPCSDGDVCTIDDSCEGGACKAFPAVWIEQVGLEDYVRTATVLVAADDGQTLVAGGAQQDVSLSVDPWLASIDAHGQVLWERTYPDAPGEIVNSGARDLCDGHGTGFVVLSTAVVPGLSQQALVIRTDAQGAELWRRDHGNASLDHAWVLIRHSHGGYIAGGWSSQGQKTTWLFKIDSAGDLAWEKNYGGGEIRDLLEVEQGNVLALGGTETSVTLRTIADNGEVVRSKTFVPQSDGVAVAQILRVGNDFVFGGTLLEPGLGERVWLVRVDAGLEQVWERRFSVSDAGSDRLNAIGFVRDQSVSFVGLTLRAGGPNGTHWDGWLAYVDGMGNLIGSEIVGTTGFDSLNALLHLPSDHMLVAGEANVENQNDRHALLLNVDAWGNRDCEEAGACAVMSMSMCDDGNPCTVDSCSEGNCASTQLPDGSPCDVDGRRCVGGACAAD